MNCRGGGGRGADARGQLRLVTPEVLAELSNGSGCRAGEDEGRTGVVVVVGGGQKDSRGASRGQGGTWEA